MSKDLQQSVEILGVGVPFVDHILEVSEDFIRERVDGKKGGMLPVSYEEFSRILKDSNSDPFLMFGGSATNTIKGLAALGHKSAIFGKVGQDVIGEMLLKNLATVSVRNYLSLTITPTAQALCLITPDKERTMRSFLGASVELTEQDLNPLHFKEVKLVHIEGYRLFNGSLVLETMKLAKKAGALISLDLSSFEVVQAFKGELMELIQTYVDILFGNELEMKALVGLDPEKNVKEINKICPIVVGLLGIKGSLIANGKEMLKIPAIKATVVDSVGAGDLYITGFLHGYLQRYSLEECGYFGSLTSGAVVEVRGVDLSIDRWDLLRDKIKNGK